MNKALSEITRVLKPDGKAIFVEPLGHNPLINLYRRFTPSLRTKDEHPLIMRDLKLMRDYFHQVDVKYFHLFTLLAIPFHKLSIFHSLLKITETIDKVVLQIPFLKRQAWQAVILLYKPKK